MSETGLPDDHLSGERREGEERARIVCRVEIWPRGNWWSAPPRCTLPAALSLAGFVAEQFSAVSGIRYITRECRAYSVLRIGLCTEIPSGSGAA